MLNDTKSQKETYEFRGGLTKLDNSIDTLEEKWKNLRHMLRL